MPFEDYDDEGADAHCVRCQAPIYFEIGPGTSGCPSCGGNYEHTDEQLVQIEIGKEEQVAVMQAEMKDTYRKIVFLHSLKEGRTEIEIVMLDEIMDEVCMFEAIAVREGRPSIYEDL